MPMIGETLADRYRVLAALGAGATSVVYRARDLRLERDVAVKVLLPNLARDPLIAGRFDREARALAAVAHPGIVSVYDVEKGEPDRGLEPYFVMELCEGGSLAEVLDASGGRLRPDALIPVLAMIAGGLAALHARGLIHRDIKPQNILLCGGTAKLADFGLARGPEMTRLTAEGTGAGTLAYLAPELLGGSEPGPAADVYALAVVAFLGLTGRLPRPSGSMVDLVDTRLAPAVAVSSVAPDLGWAFDAAVGAALAPDPAGRPPAMGFAATLEGALHQWALQPSPGPLSAAAVDPYGSTQHVRVPPPGYGGARAAGSPYPRRRRSLFGPLIAAGMLGILAAIVILVVLQAVAAGPGPIATATPRASTRPTASQSASPAPSSSSSPTPSPSVSPSPSPSPSPIPTATPTQPPIPTATPAPTPIPTAPPLWSPSQAAVQLHNVYTAIDNAEAGFTIDPPVAKSLRSAADKVQKALDRANQRDTARAAMDLSDKVQQAVDKGQLRNPGELQQIVANLLSVVGPA